MRNRKNFSTMRQGYNRYEVDDCIFALEKEVSNAKEQVEHYKQLIEQSNEQLALVKEKYQNLSSQIEIREKAADDISRIALKEANRIIGTAQTNADTIVLEAITTARSMLQELNKVSTEAIEAKEDMKAKLNDLQILLDQIQIFDTIDEKWLKD